MFFLHLVHVHTAAYIKVYVEFLNALEKHLRMRRGNNVMNSNIADKLTVRIIIRSFYESVEYSWNISIML